MKCPKCHYRFQAGLLGKLKFCPKCGARLPKDLAEMEKMEGEAMLALKPFDEVWKPEAEETPTLVSGNVMGEEAVVTDVSDPFDKAEPSEVQEVTEGSTVINAFSLDEMEDASNMTTMLGVSAAEIAAAHKAVEAGGSKEAQPPKARNQREDGGRMLDGDLLWNSRHPRMENGDRTSYPRLISVEIAQNRFFVVNKPVTLELRVRVNSSIVQKIRAWYVFEPKRDDAVFRPAAEMETNRSEDNISILMTVNYKARSAGVVLGFFTFEVSYNNMTEYYKLSLKMLSFAAKEKPQEIVSQIQRAIAGSGATKLSKRAEVADLSWLGNRGMQGDEFIAKLNAISPQYEMQELESTHWRPASSSHVREDVKMKSGDESSSEEQNGGNVRFDRSTGNESEEDITIVVPKTVLLGQDEKCVLKMNGHFFWVVGKCDCSIGRSYAENPYNDFVLLDWKNAQDRRDYPNLTISRQHVEIACVGERATLKCLSDRSSTIVNEQFIQTGSMVDLQDENIVQLGQFLLKIRLFRVAGGNIGAIVVYRMDLLPETFILLQKECSLTDVIAGIPGKKKSVKEKLVLRGGNSLSLLLPNYTTRLLKPGKLISYSKCGEIEVLDYKEYKANPFGRTGK